MVTFEWGKYIGGGLCWKGTFIVLTWVCFNTCLSTAFVWFGGGGGGGVLSALSGFWSTGGFGTI